MESVEDIWKDKSFDESSLSVLEEILIKDPCKVSFFVELFHEQKNRVLGWDFLYLVILYALPYKPAIDYAIGEEEWAEEDFSEFEWYNNGSYSPVLKTEFLNWLSYNAPNQ
ncbi:hypothetical protein [Microbulbifer sp. TRSA005]|uniref:hypothetical protein n=1 Tax=Microbulbifer sp. TRSA005 TaxID=3243383 RepID=UPI004039E755